MDDSERVVSNLADDLADMKDPAYLSDLLEWEAGVYLAKQAAFAVFLAARPHPEELV